MSDKWKYKYRLIELEDENGQRSWHIKRKCCFGFWLHFGGNFLLPLEFLSEKSALAHIEQEECQNREDAKTVVNSKIL